MDKSLSRVLTYNSELSFILIGTRSQLLEWLTPDSAGVARGLGGGIPLSILQSDRQGEFRLAEPDQNFFQQLVDLKNDLSSSARGNESGERSVIEEIQLPQSFLSHLYLLPPSLLHYLVLPEPGSSEPAILRPLDDEQEPQSLQSTNVAAETDMPDANASEDTTRSMHPQDDAHPLSNSQIRLIIKSQASLCTLFDGKKMELHNVHFYAVPYKLRTRVSYKLGAHEGEVLVSLTKQNGTLICPNKPWDLLSDGWYERDLDQCGLTDPEEIGILIQNLSSSTPCSYEIIGGECARLADTVDKFETV